MSGLLSVVGTLLGIVGLAMCVVTGSIRLTGAYYLGGFELITLFQAGIAMVIVACFLKLEGLERIP